MVDLGGAERPDKAGGNRISALGAFMAMYTGKKIDMIGAQGAIINYELTELATTVRIATEA